MKILIVVFLLHLLLNIIDSKNNEWLDVQDIRIAQTHVIPIEGKQWILNNVTFTLTIAPGRDSLLLAKFKDPSGLYKLMVKDENHLSIGSLPMKLPSELPPTEDNGPSYSNDYHFVLLPGNWIQPGMAIEFQDLYDYSISRIYNVNVGIPREAILYILPIYIFGANDTNSVALSSIKNIDDSIVDELYQKWSLSKLESRNHAFGYIDWDYLIMPPADGNASMKITNSDMKTSGYVIMDNLNSILRGIRSANGDDSTPSLIYSPILHLNKNGKLAGTYGGSGSIGHQVCVGDHYYSGVFIHEIGHSWGMWHSEEAFNAQRYPYIKGSLKGSEWGFDTTRNEFLSIYVPKSAEYYPNCLKSFVKSDDGKYCIKQSVMQGGAGDQSSRYRFTMFADFEMTVIEDTFKKAIYFKNGTYQKWDSSNNQYYQYTPKTKSDGLYGQVNDGTPIERDVNIYTLVFTYSTVGPEELNQFYPIIKSRGNLLQYFDPTNKTDIQNVIPFSSSPIHSYCYAEGCDYTLRVTYRDGSLKHILISSGNRKWGNANKDIFKDNLNNPKSSESFKLFVYNVKADKELSLVELLYTPMGWNGVPDNAKVLASRKL